MCSEIFISNFERSNVNGAKLPDEPASKVRYTVKEIIIQAIGGALVR